MIKMTKLEWVKRGIELFGIDVRKWKFVCPSCGNIQTIEDFRKYKEQGATAEDVRFNCIGRFTGSQNKAFGQKGVTKSPCDYSSGGVFDINPLVVVNEDTGKEFSCFGFAV